jgi:hypothetical protein
VNNLTDAETLIKTAQPGLMLYGRVKQSISDPWKTVFYIREDDEHIKAIPKNPPVELRIAVMKEDDVLLMPTLIRLNNTLYETWFNYETVGKLSIADLTQQDMMILLIFGDKRQQERSIAFKNSVRATFDSFLQIRRESKIPSWTLSEFDAAREKVYTKFPTPKALWNEIS